MNSSQETTTKGKSQPQLTLEELEPDESEDEQLTYFLANSQFRNEWRWKDRESCALFDHLECEETKKLNDLIDKVINNSWFEDEMKEKLTMAVKDVIYRTLSRGAAAVTNGVDWMDLAALLAQIYEHLGLDMFGGTDTIIPKFELQLMEYKQETGLEPLEMATKAAVKEKSVEPEDAEEHGESSAEDEFTSSTGPKKTQNCYSNIGVVVDGKKYARYGVAYPDYWKLYPNVIKAGILKSLEMRINKIPSEKCHIVDDKTKYKAIERVLLHHESCKANSVKYGINYSTMQNYVHRAIYVLSKILGTTEVPKNVKKMLDDKVDVTQIVNTFDIKRPVSQVRVSFPASA
ncbi:unnamed protein product [Bursaphelenchus okinawaensis]|uniref:Uncharacterized protein n=1 Tax=Bursaphelenchus okinawaensis TaxID=465554 RepID=A0A811LP61_9BILA|nr:unnamed protein product [Bursaphelenchus okinawaensis]CAG9125339.1 unnamed protein product [Bursaphelenchus okinawaensis]